jgi:hypothetical protein
VSQSRITIANHSVVLCNSLAYKNEHEYEYKQCAEKLNMISNHPSIAYVVSKVQSPKLQDQFSRYDIIFS